ncbi:patatin-like phospholipase family protein [Flavisolibacter ginsenosidimutans]|uniref:Patatin-like phospholipase family protein n=1 Tax=Flavisolibacter ginsenosidimutans TaxID=661481 RepID=A0A5B8ULJ5_9BACT|nr:patatin-like phospholipase family protein [Flavisolibacter ginsenosidimutans]QEC57544.1 patatin-like phospholipase family protein [Flavisolibacter ginsenosidimutans]
MPQPETNKKFYVGVCMAGAVSAGAYTAGVMDYLMEALEEWRKQKESGNPNTPSHEVEIPVIGGASAGGMTGIITAAALNHSITPVKPPQTANAKEEHPENKFYHSWVDLLGEDMFSMMLDTADMEDEQIISLLNSSFIDTVASRVVQTDAVGWKPAPPYISKDLKVFATLTNLEGFGYNIAMKGTGKSPAKYYMSIHNDYACFKLNADGEMQHSEEDGWIPLDFKTGENTDVAKNAAMATGAFPVGLKSRELKREAAEVNKLPFCRDVTDHFPVKGPYCTTLNVDGGVINNEPFERVREVLNNVATDDEKEDENGNKAYNNENKFGSTVLLIDPFPSHEPGAFKSSQKLFDVVGLTFGAMLEQMRAKPAKLADAMNDNCVGQFLIAPSRRLPKLDGTEKDAAGDEAIACGAMGGFSGFLNKEFRIHDYFLGRFNCELFLRDYFTVSEKALNENEIFRQGYAGINKEAFASKRKEGHYQIIPIFTPHPPEGQLPMPVFSSGSNWPVMEEKKVDAFEPAVRKRAQGLLMNSVKLKGIEKFLVWVGAKVVLNGLLTKKVMDAIKKSLQAQELLRGAPGEGKVSEGEVRLVRKEPAVKET